MKKLLFISSILLYISCHHNEGIEPASSLNYTLEETTNSWHSNRMADYLRVNIYHENYIGTGIKLPDSLQEAQEIFFIKFHNFNKEKLIEGPYWFHQIHEGENLISIDFIDQASWWHLFNMLDSNSGGCDQKCQDVFNLGDFFYKSTRTIQQGSFFIIDQVVPMANGYFWLEGHFEVKLASFLEKDKPKTLAGSFKMPLKTDY